MSKDDKKAVKENNSYVSAKSFNNYTKKIDKYHNENKNHVFNVRMVEDKTIQKYSLSFILFIVCFVLALYIIFNIFAFIDCLKAGDNIVSFFVESLKELVYASGLGFVVVFVNSIVFRRKK